MNDPDDLDALVTELNAGVAAAPGRMDTPRVCASGSSRSSPSRPAICCWWRAPRRCSGSQGAVVPIGEGPLGGEEIADAVEPALPPHARRAYRESGIADASYRTPDLGRFRINLHRERGRAGGGNPAAAGGGAPSRQPRPAAERRGAEPAAARAGAHRRSNGIGQDDDDRGARERNQSSRHAPHHHHRGSDRIRAPAPPLPDRARRDRHRRPGFSDRAARRPAPGPRRHRRRRDARSRDHADCAGRRRDRAPGVFEPAHHGCGDDHRPDRRFVSARTAEHGPAGAGDGAGGGAGADA